MPRFEWIAFDADDTLWHNERLFAKAQVDFKVLLARYLEPELIEDRLYETEVRNLPHFGYGIKAFTLSMIETALELTEGRIEGRDVKAIINMAKAMLSADVELLDQVPEAIGTLAKSHNLMLITKGDLQDQERKIKSSGLGPAFRHLEIVSDKGREAYAALLRRYDIAPETFAMVGNSLRSDILPVLSLGAGAIYIPYQLTWAHEVGTPPEAESQGYYTLPHIGLLPGLIERLDQEAMEPPAWSI